MDVDKPFFSFSGETDDVFTIRDCFTGFQIFGGTGSGKTSGSGKYLAKRFLKAGFGGLVLTVKPDECTEWQEWAAQAGREENVIIFKPSNHYRFDFINYEKNRDGEGAGSTFNIVDLLITACDIAKPNISASAGDNQFFVDAGNELIAKTVDLLSLSRIAMTVDNILEIINTAPSNSLMETLESGYEVPKTIHSEHFGVKSDEERQRGYKKLFAFAVIRASSIQENGQFTKQQIRDFKACYSYFFSDYAALGERTRSSIKLNVTTTLYQLLRGEMGLLFCNGKPEGEEVEISPDWSYTKKSIIIVDMPIMEWKTVGKLAQGLFKYMFQRAIERRRFKEYPHPVFIWADEAQYFLNRSDMMFLTTARSSGCATVYLTQNIENYYSIMEESVTRSMIGNLQTKIFHQNTDVKTNEYATSIIGKIWEETKSRSINVPSSSSVGGISRSKSEQLINKIEPEKFNELRTGGLHNDLIVDAVVFSGGRKWFNTDDVFDLVQFKQG